LILIENAWKKKNGFEKKVFGNLWKEKFIPPQTVSFWKPYFFIFIYSSPSSCIRCIYFIAIFTTLSVSLNKIHQINNKFLKQKKNGKDKWHK
jgi:hypothetical protein